MRESPAVDARSGVSARFGVAAAETAAASALRRSALTGEDPAVARVCDLPAVVPTLLGKVEFEVDEEGREVEVLAHLLRRATAETFRHRLGASDLQALIERFDEGSRSRAATWCPAGGCSSRSARSPGLARRARRCSASTRAPRPRSSPPPALEFALEGLYLNRRISKDDGPTGGIVYGSPG